MTPPVLKNIRNFATIINQQPRTNMDKKTIEEVIKGEVDRGNFSVEGIAAKLFITPFTFRRQFERLFHESPKKYLQRARMNKAKQLLREHPETTIETIGHTLGYTDKSNFNRAFRTAFGITPSEFRAQCETTRINNNQKNQEYETI